MGNTWLVTCIPLDTWLCMYSSWHLTCCMSSWVMILGLLHVFLMSHNTWFIAWLTLGLLHVFHFTLGLLHVFCMIHDTWFIAWVTPSLLHALLLTLGLLHVFLMSHDTLFIEWVTPSLLHVLLLTLRMHFRCPMVQMTESFCWRTKKRRIVWTF